MQLGEKIATEGLLTARSEGMKEEGMLSASPSESGGLVSFFPT